MKREYFILLPGWTRSERTYKEFIKGAPQGIAVEFIKYQEIIPDGRIDLFSERLSDFLKRKKLSRVSLIGFSLGGALGFEFSLKYPEMINIFYLVNAAGIYGKESVFEIFKNQTANLFERKGAKLFRSVRNSNALAINPILNLRLGLYANKIDLRKNLVTKDFPQTIILWGEKDVVHPLWQGEEFNKLIPNSKLIVIKNGGHDWLVHVPQEFWKQIKKT